MSVGGRRGSLAPAFLHSEGKEAAAGRGQDSLLCKVDFIKGLDDLSCDLSLDIKYY